MLLSGGIDSMACADFYLNMARPVCGVFVDYGQPAARLEATAAQVVAQHLGIPIMNIVVNTIQPKLVGEIPARNAMLVMLAAMERSSTVRAIALGIHAGTSYQDCSPEFVESARRLLSLQGSPVDVLAPFLDWHKQDVLAYAVKRQLPLHATYSCESGILPPCGTCVSCLDRSLLDAGAPSNDQSARRLTV